MNTDRIYQAEDEQWYFSIRGNQALGPFTSYHEADSALRAHVTACNRRVSGNILWPIRLGMTRRNRSAAAPRHT